jgi:branched-chain amino acid transport system permease protein
VGFYIVQFLTGLANAAALFLVASGLSIIFGVTRIVNFAHGSFYMLGAYLGYTMINAIGGTFLGFWGALLVASVIVGLVGVVVEMTILRRVYQAPELFQLIATFGVILVIQDATQFLWGSEDLLGPRAPLLKGAVEIDGALLPTYDIALILLSPIVLGGLWLLFNRTRWGILVRAATQDREMVGTLGVNQAWLFTGVFFLGSALAALGGAAQLPKGGATLLMDFNILAAVFVVVVVGGMGSIPGAFLAAVLISELNSFGILIWSESTLVLMFAVMAIVLIFRPYGLLGTPEDGSKGEAGPLEAPYRPAPMQVKLLLAAIIAMVVALPLTGDEFMLVLATDMLILALFATSLHFLMGPGGLVSFGHAAYFGGGAYGAALLVTYASSSMELAILLAPLCAAAMALIVGWFCVRLRGVYFAMLTLAFAQVGWSIAFQWSDVTNGDDGLLGIWPSSWASDRLVFFYLVALVCIAGIILIRHVLFSNFGYGLRAARDSSQRSEAIGINTSRQQWIAFVFAGAMAGRAGALYVFSKGSVFPDQMSIQTSFDALLMVLLGGVQTLAGPFVGATIFTWLHDALTTFEYWRLIIGIIIIALVVLFPQGVVGSLKRYLGKPFGLEERW